MPQETTNLKLKVYDNVNDKEVHYIDYRTAQSGISNSNMTKIDDAYGDLKQDIQNIDISEQIETHNTSDMAHEDIRNLISNMDVSGQVNVGIENHNTNELSHPSLIQQLNENATDLSTHKTEKVTDLGGVHGFEIEEGTWTPTLIGTSVSGVNSYSQQNGYYKKNGNVVYINCEVSLTVKDEAMAGNVEIGGLPFTTMASRSRHTMGQLYYTSIKYKSGYTSIGTFLLNGRSSIGLVWYKELGTYAPCTVQELNNDTIFAFSGFYFI